MTPLAGYFNRRGFGEAFAGVKLKKEKVEQKEKGKQSIKKLNSNVKY